ncbi:helix-turn-helix transcriptional regulator [Micromonospora sp. RL09-050-HVF-A]|uniref:helix-turn-helix domain-containing protein n=1 Tax=unclassified Micromonospora TaxID=2617518 RepID=UPI001C5EBE96|nr:helix-turn-helix transcriptional regulator [Micromonospora sp. RL09-050-HVF-A]MBW4702604.1 hypothetical protein [Micromonospora sp. RL09-050-HVF-A]
MFEEHPDELFAARLNHLFEVARRPGGLRWENSEVGARCGLSRAQLHNLRNPKQGGNRSRGPTWETINALASFFEVEPNYFFLPATSTPQSDLGRRMADLEVQHVAMNTVGEDLAQVKATVIAVLAHIQRIEDQLGGHVVTGEADGVDGERWTTEQRD